MKKVLEFFKWAGLTIFGGVTLAASCAVIALIVKLIVMAVKFGYNLV